MINLLVNYIAVVTTQLHRYDRRMCRSIHRLRDGRVIDDHDAMVEAARQYVRKVSGFSRPAEHNQMVLENAVTEISAATQKLMDGLVVR